MTLPNPGSPISLLDVFNEAQISASSPWYGRGANLGSYRGVQWWKDDTSTGLFPSGSITLGDFYSKRSTSPVTPSTQTFTSSGTFTTPLYSVLTITIRAGAGGGGGESGNVSAGGAGGTGGASSFGAYGSALPGGGGGPGGNNYTGAAGAGSDGTPAGGNGGSSGNGAPGGTGGAGGRTVITLYNPISGTLPSGPAVGATVAITVGVGGSGGSAGSFYNGFVVLPCSGGANGGAGSVVINIS